MSHTPEQIAATIRQHWLNQGLALNQVAEQLNISPAALSNILSRPISKRTAQIFSDRFGFDKSYLLTGEGSLFPLVDSNDAVIASLRETIRAQQETIRLLSGLLANEKGDTIGSIPFQNQNNFLEK